MKQFPKKFTLLHVVGFSIAAAAITFFSMRNNTDQTTLSDTLTPAYSCKFNVKRLEGYSLIKPLLYVDEDCESEHLMNIKSQILNIIDKYKKTGALKSSSVYLRNSQTSEWICTDESEQFEPGSLFKVADMITILKMAEDHPGFLNKRIAFDKPITDNLKQAFPSKSIQFGHTYTVRELLEYMICYSDNKATTLLEMNMDMNALQKLFADLGLEVPNIQGDHYYFTARQFSVLMRAIYNAGYLTIKNSEYAAELLSQSDFKQGIAKGIPPNVKIAHKFGESGNENEKQLHESAIIYLDSHAYLLTVMTKGKDSETLSKLIAEISSAVYVDMVNQEKSM